MNIKKHIILFLVGITAWSFFYIIGLPSNYFINWNLDNKILLCLITFFAVVPFIGFLIILFLGGDYIKTSLWTAFYASAPLFLLDYFIVGIIKNEGFHFLISHWYISIAYLYVWVELPIIGVAIKKLKEN